MPGRIICAVALLGVIFSFGVSAQQNLPGVSRVERVAEARQERQEALAAIAADRAAFVAGIVAAWSDYAAQAGFTAGWWAELEEVLNMLPAERLADAKNATTYSELRTIILGRGATALDTPLTAVVDPKLIGSENIDLVYTPVAPCRLVDTRNSAAGPLLSGTSRAFYHHDSASPGGELAAQGGNGAGCGIPTDPAALAINITAVGGSGIGHLTAWPFNSPMPLASVLNYNTGWIVANSTIVPMCQICGADFNVFAATTTHVLVDVMGYFWSPIATPLDVVSVTNSATVAGSGGTWDMAALCPTGRTVTGGGVDITGLPPNVFVAQNSANATGNAWQTRGINNGAGSITVTVQARCGKVPGR
ncbi:MAG: hypothetical protein ACE148_15610 [Vicinamibacterales bacterium]